MTPRSGARFSLERLTNLHMDLELIRKHSAPVLPQSSKKSNCSVSKPTIRNLILSS